MNQNLFTTNGSGRRQTWFEVDGSTGNDSWGRQTIFATVPISAVQEMTVLTNSFSAEYGASAGGAISIVTRSGGNRLRGQILEIWRPAATEAALSFRTGRLAWKQLGIARGVLLDARRQFYPPLARQLLLRDSDATHNGTPSPSLRGSGSIIPEKVTTFFQHFSRATM